MDPEYQHRPSWQAFKKVLSCVFVHDNRVLPREFGKDHRGTFLQYSSYSAPNIFPSVGSSYSRTNNAVPTAATNATVSAARFARPKTTHRLSQPTKNPTYIGFRTYR